MTAASPGSERLGSEASHSGALVGKTVLMGVENGFEARYLLRTEIFRTLQDAGARLVVLVPNPEEAYLQQELSGSHVWLERLELDRLRSYTVAKAWRSGPAHLRRYMLGDNTHTSTLDEKLKVSRRSSDSVSWRAFSASVAFMRRSRLARRGLVSFESRANVGHFHRAIFERFEPDLVVVPGPGFTYADTFLLREARRHRVRSVAVVPSWDNTTSKGYAGARADWYVAWTEIMKRELVRCHDVEPSRVLVGGAAHLDIYASAHGWTRDELFDHMGLDPERHLIFFGTSALEGFPHLGAVEALGRAMDDDLLTERCQLVLRLHPNALREEGAKTSSLQAEVAALQSVEHRYQHVMINTPEIRSQRLRTDMPWTEMELVVALLRHASVVVNVFSTLNLEAALCDRPVVNVVFPSAASSAEAPFLSARAAMDYTHNRRMLQWGATRVATTPRELVDLVNGYLREPSLDAQGRRRLVEAECAPFDGGAGRRIGRHLVSLAAAGVSP